MASLYPGASITYLGDEATEEHAKQLDKTARHIHFACHGRMNQRSPFDSALLLTMPSPIGAGQDNGVLSAWEILDHVRIDADLVTLSACETALGQEQAGEGLIGLTRAFQYAGARSVLSSLWKISDRSTARLMQSFYRHLRSGASKDEALRLAQIEAIRRPANPGSLDLSDPFYWAGFELLGDWR